MDPNPGCEWGRRRLPELRPVEPVPAFNGACASWRMLPSDCPSERLAAATEERIRALPGVEVVGHGKLSEPEQGHGPGTPYVVIQADCVSEARLAGERLAAVARVPQGRWHGTWDSQGVNGSCVLQRRIYPTFDLLGFS